MIKVQTLKGFRDFLPEQARKRQYAINTIKSVFESFGFEPLETPALEYEEILLGKYGEEGDKLMYRFEDNGKRRVALRYDQTVPLARVVAQYQNELPIPFKRYQIQPVWRAENTQKGRFREFLQCDADIVGLESPLSDAEVIALAVKAVEKLGFTKYKILINDRSVFDEIPKAAITTIDKLKKIGGEGVKKELLEKGLDPNVLEIVQKKEKTSHLEEIFSHLTKLEIKPLQYEFSPTLARGLDYYTGLIFEIEIEGYNVGSVCGGGRYDKLIGMFAGKDIPAVGFAFGFDRLIEAMEQFNLFPKNLVCAKVLVTIFASELKDISIKAANNLRDAKINTELFLDENIKLEKQLKYADQKSISFAIIIGPEELKNNQATLKDLSLKTQETLPLDEIIKKLQ